MFGSSRRRLIGMLGVAAVTCVLVIAPVQAGQAADPPVPVITSASLKITDRYLGPDDVNGIFGSLTLHIEMDPNSAIAAASALYRSPGTGCTEATYEPQLAGSVTRDGAQATVIMPIRTCGTLYESYPDHPGAYELGLGDTRSGALHGVYLEWGYDTPRHTWLAAPTNVQKFHLWSITRISQSTSLSTINGVRYRNLAGVLQGWDAPNEKWKRFAGGKVSLFFTPPGGTRRWVATKDTASDGTYHFRTSNTKPGTWTVYFRTTVHYWTSSRSLAVP